MAKTEKENYQFEGTITYLMRRPDDRYGNYTFNFYPVDHKAVKATGIRSNVKLDDDMKPFFTFGKKEPWVVYDTNGDVIEKIVGNGSKATIRLTVEKFDTKDYGRVTRGTVSSIVVTDLIEYVPPQPEEDKTEVKADLPV